MFLIILLAVVFVFIAGLFLFIYFEEKADPFVKFQEEFFLNSANPMLCYAYSPRLFKKKYIKRRAEEVISFCEKHGIELEEFSNHLEKTGDLYETYDFFIEKTVEVRHRRITP